MTEADRLFYFMHSFLHKAQLARASSYSTTNMTLRKKFVHHNKHGSKENTELKMNTHTSICSIAFYTRV